MHCPRTYIDKSGVIRVENHVGQQTRLLYIQSRRSFFLPVGRPTDSLYKASFSLCICHPVMNGTQPQQHSKDSEEISGLPTFFAENQLDPNLDQQFSNLNFHASGRNSTISAVEKSFKDEEHIYVSIFSPSI